MGCSQAGAIVAVEVFLEQRIIPDILAVVAFAVGEPEEALLEDGIFAVPQGQGETEALLVVGEPDQAVAVPDLMAEIGDVAGEDNAVGYGNDLVFVSFLAGDIELAFQYYPHGLPHLDHIAFLERPGIGQADPRNQVGNGRR